MLTQVINFIVYIGLPFVAFYHEVRENIFFGVSAADASGFEMAGDVAFVPFHYLIGAREAIPINNGEFAYEIKQKFQYEDDLTGAKICGATIAAPFSLLFGTVLKGVSYFSSDTWKRRGKIQEVLHAPKVVSQLSFFKQCGIEFAGYEGLNEQPSQGYQRREGEENHLAAQKEGMRAILEIFKKHGIISWADCGTCLGALRYGGVIPWDEDIDLAILVQDHENALRALQELDSDLFVAQDWSGRARPKSYIRVYVKEVHDHIDIYHYNIDPETQLITQVFSNEMSRYMPEWWKIRERRFVVPTPVSTIFPLKRAMFDGIEIYVPNDSEEYLKARYGDNILPAMIYNEIEGAYVKDLSHPYWEREFVK